MAWGPGLQGRVAHPRIIWEFHWRISVHPQFGKCRIGLHQLGASPLNRLVCRGPRPGPGSLPAELRQVCLACLAGRLGYPSELGQNDLNAYQSGFGLPW